STGAPMPSGRYFPNDAYFNGKIYVLGGFDGNTFTEQTNTWEYDPVANTWTTTRAAIPTGVGGAGTTVENGFIHLMGGWNSGSGSNLHYRYAVATNTWTTQAPIPANTYEPGAGVLGGKIYLFGGGNPFRPG